MISIIFFIVSFFVKYPVPLFLSADGIKDHDKISVWHMCAIRHQQNVNNNKISRKMTGFRAKVAKIGETLAVEVSNYDGFHLFFTEKHL